MPGRVKVRIVAGRNLPVMDRTNETTDAYVEVRFGSTTYKTEVCRKTLSPQWNSEWFRFEVDDASLQDEPLQIRVMDHDTYSANDAIGKVYIDLNPLLLPSFARTVPEGEGSNSSGGAVMNGWIPIYDTIHGLRGEVSIILKVDFISNFNKYRKSSCGVQIFYAPSVPWGYTLGAVHGFVEELVVNNDPEYQWIDKIRTPRASNEARQVLFCKLSGEVQRKIGLKALELGGNAILGYKVCFDLEGESGVVVRGIGTAVTICRSIGGLENIHDMLTAFGSNFSTRQRLNTPYCPVLNIVPPSRVSSIGELPAKISGFRRAESFAGSAAVVESASRKISLGNNINANRPKTFGHVYSMTGGCKYSQCVVPEIWTNRRPVQREGILARLNTNYGSNGKNVYNADRHGRSAANIYSPASEYLTNRPEFYLSDTDDESECPSVFLEEDDSSDYPVQTLPEFPFVEETVSSQTVLSTSPARLSPRSSFHGRTSSVSTQGPVRKYSTAVPPPPLSPGRGRSSKSDYKTAASLEAEYRNADLIIPKYSVSGPPPKSAVKDSGEILEYPFLTMSAYPDDFILRLGGTVSARSVKLLDRIHNPDEPETRDAWWTELRMEIRSHTKALACNVVLGYEEKTSIWEEICILSASGTAAFVAGVQYNDPTMLTYGIIGYPMPSQSAHEHMRKDSFRSTSSGGEQSAEETLDTEKELEKDGCPLSVFSPDSSPCGTCHAPYGDGNAPFPVSLKRCQVCWNGKVPDSLILTIEPPNKIPRIGKGTLIQGRVSRPLKDCKAEQLAKEISDSLPFLEYEMYRQLINKLRVKGMNCICGLTTQISIGDKLLIGVATGTACYFAALPPPTVPRILASHSSSSMKSENGDGDSSVSDIQKKLCELVAANKKTFGLAKTPEIIEAPRMALERAQRVSDSDDEHLPHLDLSAGNKDTCVLEIDDCEDLDVINLLMDPKPPLDFEVSNIEDYICNGRSKTSNPQDTFVESDDELPQNQLFTKIWRGNVTPPFTSKDLSRIMDRLIHGTCYRFRKAEPKIVRMVRVNVTSVEEDELQVILTGVSLGTPSFSYNMNHWKKLSASTEPSVESDAETVKSLKESSDGACETELKPSTSSIGRKPSSNLTLTVPDSGVNRIVAENSFELPTPVLITPLTWIHGKKPESYLGNLNFFFVRETMNVKECGGLSIFVSSFVAEVLSIVRAHVRALGGNALISYSMSECSLMHSAHKSQAQCLLNVGGDVVKLTDAAKS